MGVARICRQARSKRTPKRTPNKARTGNGLGFVPSGGSTTLWVYGYVSYATPIKALHHAHVYNSVARKCTFAPICGPIAI